MSTIYAEGKRLSVESSPVWTAVPQPDGGVWLYSGVRVVARFEPEFADDARFVTFARRYFSERTPRELKALREVVTEAANLTYGEGISDSLRSYHRKLLADFAGYIDHLRREME